MKHLRPGCAALLALLALPTPGVAQELPGVWFLNSRGTGAADARQRLAVGGSDLRPPDSQAQVCLGWVWSEPRPDIDPYPDPAPGTFGKAESTWSLQADGTTVTPCRSEKTVPFPLLGVGPAGELWLVEPAAEPPRRYRWAELLHAVEAAYRQSVAAAPTQATAPVPSLSRVSTLSERVIGTLGRCAVRSLPVDLRTRLDLWSPVELPGHARPGEIATGEMVDSIGAPATGELVRARRFLWWVDPDPAGDLCGAEDESPTLRLFPLPAAEPAAPEGAPTHFLTIAGVDWRSLSYFELTHTGAGPLARRLVEDPSRNLAESAGPVEIAVNPTPEQRRELASNPAFDLCTIAGLGELCRRNQVARRQLSTAIEDPEADPPWPGSRLRSAQRACESVLGELAVAADACTSATLWEQPPIAGELAAGFRGELRVSRQPQIRETWHDGVVEWRLVAADDDPRGALAAVPELDLRLLDGTRFKAATRELRDGGSRWVERLRWGALIASLALFAGLATLLLGRRRRGRRRTDHRARQDLERLVDRVVRRRLAATVRPGPSPETAGEQGLRPQASVAAEAEAEDLEHHSVGLEEQLRERSAALQRELAASEAAAKQALQHEAQSLSEALRHDLDTRAAAGVGEWQEQALASLRELAVERIDEQLAPRLAEVRRLEPLFRNPQSLDRLARLQESLASHPDLADKLLTLLQRLPQESLSSLLDPFAARVLARPRAEMERQALAGFQTLSRELEELEAEDREPLVAALEGVGQLGYWIDQLWPALRQVAGTELEAVAADLPPAAGSEWRSAYETLRRFSLFDAVAIRRLLRMSAGEDPGALPPQPPSAAEAAVLDHAGLLDGERALRERLKQYLEPFDHAGCLGAVTLALQYLVEAYPVEHLPKGRGPQLRRQVAEAAEGVHLEGNFHHLVQAIAAGIDLRYRPVIYYKSRIDQKEFSFARQQVSPILLTDRVGFAATTEPSVVVRLKRPFFFQLSNDLYYAGHAHVARG